MSSTYRIPSINYLKPQLVDDGFYASIKIDSTTTANTHYVGLHIDKDAATSSPDWKVYKIVGNTDVTFNYGAWDDRTTL